MNSVLLSSGAVSEIAGMSRGVLDSWCHAEPPIVVPVDGGSGSGDYRKFSVMQVVGILVGCALRETTRGCALSFVREIVAGFGNVAEDWLQERFAEKRTHFANCVYGTGHIVLQSVSHPAPDDATEEYPLLPALDLPRYPDWVDVAAIYQRVRAFVERKGHKAAPSPLPAQKVE